ncbi:unnamed protein product [Strongylus vulgaris]|uniref:Uncharacterized protein n=1 Tax=Strongylus vulgaris TaxID=40348 RepID=A0A3P7L9H5_STRVU|nr:unnamed protein product [Strongylus vulgaris]
MEGPASTSLRAPYCTSHQSRTPGARMGGPASTLLSGYCAYGLPSFPLAFESHGDCYIPELRRP